ncbi:MAG: acyl carrier protein [Candidatus Zixiibacteriota bacterium]
MATIDIDTTRQELKAFILETFLFGDDSDGFGNSDSFMERGIIDSTGVLELVSHLEQTYGISVEDEEMIPANLDSIDNLAAFVQRKAG